jgi:hypothetical protein
VSLRHLFFLDVEFLENELLVGDDFDIANVAGAAYE